MRTRLDRNLLIQTTNQETLNMRLPLQAAASGSVVTPTGQAKLRICHVATSIAHVLAHVLPGSRNPTAGLGCPCLWHPVRQVYDRCKRPFPITADASPIGGAQQPGCHDPGSLSLCCWQACTCLLQGSRKWVTLYRLKVCCAVLSSRSAFDPQLDPPLD